MKHKISTEYISGNLFQSIIPKEITQDEDEHTMDINELTAAKTAKAKSAIK